MVLYDHSRPSSGSSYKNRVELQNGCLALAHANLFIPSTLNGSCMVTEKVSNDLLCENLDAAIDIYIFQEWTTPLVHEQ